MKDAPVFLTSKPEPVSACCKAMCQTCFSHDSCRTSLAMDCSNAKSPLILSIMTVPAGKNWQLWRAPGRRTSLLNLSIVTVQIL